MIADNVRRRREAAGLSQAELADAMVDRGVPWRRATVVNLERRAAATRGTAVAGRDTVSVGELLALASVFGCPPVVLVADPRHTAAVALGPDDERDVWAALVWLTGIRAWNDERRTLTPEQTLVEAAVRIGEAAALLRLPPPTEQDDEFDEIHRDALFTITDATWRIAQLGGALPNDGLDWDAITARARELGVYVPGIESAFGED